MMQGLKAVRQMQLKILAHQLLHQVMIFKQELIRFMIHHPKMVCFEPNVRNLECENCVSYLM